MKTIPTNPIEITNLIAKMQNESGVKRINPIYILFNKGRYFECTIYPKPLLISLSKAAKIKIRHTNMLVGNRIQLVALIKALNKRGFYAKITLDWI